MSTHVVNERQADAPPDPATRNVEVDSSHAGISVNRDVYRVLDEILEEEPAWSG